MRARLVEEVEVSTIADIVLKHVSKDVQSQEGGAFSGLRIQAMAFAAFFKCMVGHWSIVFFSFLCQHDTVS